MQPLNSLSKWCQTHTKNFTQEEQHPLNALHTFIENNPKLHNSRDIYPFYSYIFKIATSLEENSAMQREFFRILGACNGHFLPRKKLSPLMLDFEPILQIVQQKKRLYFRCSVIDSSNSKEIKEAAKAINHLSLEGVGHSCGTYIYKSIIRSPVTLCVVMRNDKDQIIGCTLGTSVQLNEGALKVFHFWLAVRKASYPAVRLTENFRIFEESIARIYDPDYLTLNVDDDNVSAKELYKNIGFEVIEPTLNYSTSKIASFMAKPMSIGKEPPKAAEVTQEITQNTLKTIGKVGLSYFAALKLVQAIQNVPYR